MESTNIWASNSSTHIHHSIPTNTRMGIKMVDKFKEIAELMAAIDLQIKNIREYTGVHLERIK